MQTLLLTVEIPTNSKQRFEEYILSSLEYYKLISDKISFNINFQKEFTNEDILKYQNIFREYELEMNYIVSDYSDSEHLVRIREDTHQINNKAKYSLSIDDDISIKSKAYIDTLNQILRCMEDHKTIGCICIEGPMYGHCTERSFYIKPCQYRHNFYTDGGIVVRNISESLFPKECLDLIGGKQDKLLIMSRIWSGYSAYYTYNRGYWHYEHRRGFGDTGAYKYNWHIHNDKQGSVAYYLVEHEYKYDTPKAIYNYSEVVEHV